MIKDISHLESATGNLLFCRLAGHMKHSGKYIPELPDDFLFYLSKRTKKPVEYWQNIRSTAYNLFKFRHEQKKKNIVWKNIEILKNHQNKFGNQFVNISSIANFWEMGTGKTLAVLSILKQKINQTDNILVLCPSSVLGSWDKAIKKYCPDDFFYCVLSGSTKQKLSELNSGNFNLVITNYHSLLNDKIFIEFIKKRFWFVVADESDAIKNPRGKITERALILSEIAHTKIIMAGTSINRDVRDLWSQIYFSDNGKRLGHSYSEFEKEYEILWSDSYKKSEFEEQKKTLREKLYSKIADITTRITLSDVWDEMPESSDFDYDWEISGDALAAYNQAVNEARVVFSTTYGSEEISISNRISMITRLHQICGGGINGNRLKDNKISVLLEIVDKLTQPFIVVCRYSDEIFDIKKSLLARGINIVESHGKISQRNRIKNIDFFSSGQADCIILQIDSSGAGIDGLQNFSNDMIFYSKSYRWSSLYQTRARILRIGQKNACRYFNLTAKLASGKMSADDMVNLNLSLKNDDINSFLKICEENL